jgi:hypothetical protein
MQMSPPSTGIGKAVGKAGDHTPLETSADLKLYL